MAKLTIVMYHYVRDLKDSRYPEIKGLHLEDFRGQMAYLAKHYTIVRMEDVIAAIQNGKQLPGNACLLTFDDGFTDHFTCVFPLLDELGVQGSFFPPAKAIMEHEILDVHKIHFILASVADKQLLIQDINAMLDEHRNAYQLHSNEHYHNEYAKPTRYDSPDIVYIKSILQKAIPADLRFIITDQLFRKYVHSDMKAFAKELYMSVDQIKCMKRNGMFIGSHAWSHYWLNTLTPEEQVKEVDLSMEFLEMLGCTKEEFVMCYPYGAFDDSLLDILEARHCPVGRDNKLTLPRLDTNDFPRSGDAPVNKWTAMIMEQA